MPTGTILRCIQKGSSDHDPIHDIMTFPHYQEDTMKRILAAAAVLCLLLCSCEGEKADAPESSSASETTVTETTVAETTSEETTAPAETTDTQPTSETTTAAESTAAASESAESTKPASTTAPSNDAVIDISGQTTAEKPGKSTETVTETTTQANSGDVSNGNELQDDGLNWTPLVPVD